MQFKYLKYDMYRYFYPNDEIHDIGLYEKLRIIVTTHAIWAIVVYRFSRWVVYECKNKILRKLLKPVVLFSNLFITMLTGIQIWTEADIGPGLYIGHFGCILIGPTKLGKFCNISHENTIGFAGRGKKHIPEVGDFLYMGAGAKVIGNVTIGNNVAIGANAVVTKDMPDNAVAIGIPAKIKNYGSSKGLVNFNRRRFKEIIDETSDL